MYHEKNYSCPKTICIPFIWNEHFIFVTSSFSRKKYSTPRQDSSEQTFHVIIYTKYNNLISIYIPKILNHELKLTNNKFSHLLKQSK
jgi:hypothetical protein